MVDVLLYIIFGLVLLVMAPYAVIALAGMGTWLVATLRGPREAEEESEVEPSG